MSQPNIWTVPMIHQAGVQLYEKFRNVENLLDQSLHLQMQQYMKQGSIQCYMLISL